MLPNTPENAVDFLGRARCWLMVILLHPSDVSCVVKEKNYMPPQPLLVPVLGKSAFFCLLLEGSPFVDQACSASLDLLSSYFSEDVWLKLYRQNIPLVWDMSVAVSDLPRMFILMFSNDICLFHSCVL